MPVGRAQAGVPAAEAPKASPGKEAMLAPRVGEEAVGEALRHPVTVPSAAMALSTQAMGIAQEAKDCPVKDAAPLPLLLLAAGAPLVQVK